MEYQVDFTPALVVEVRQIIDAAPEDAAEPLLGVLREIIGRLRRGPLDFGEPRYNLHHPGATVRVGVLGLLAVQFAVFSEEHRVWLLSVVVMSGPGA